MTNKCLNTIAGALLLTALLLANTASARTLLMSGEWFMNRGPLVDVPANGGPVFCGVNLLTGCVNNLRPLNGGIPAAGANANVTGIGQPAFTIPPKAFALAGGAANRQTVPVAGIPTVIQLASQFSLLAPAGSGTDPNVLAPAGIARFETMAWSKDAQQAGRLATTFTWCPPAGACVTPTLSQTYGAYRAQIKYTKNAGGNAFGGTMNMMLRDTGVVSIRVGASSPFQVLHQLVGGATNPEWGKQVAGGGYLDTRVLTLAPGPLFATYMIGTPCTTGFGQAPMPPGCGVITGQGPFITSLPGSINNDFGMPWTTGTVFVKNLPGPIPSQDPASTFSVMGTDNRTANGAGRITLVAGATTERKPSGSHFAALEVMNLSFGAQAAPLLSAPAIGALVVLMLLAGGYMARRSFASTEA